MTKKLLSACNQFTFSTFYSPLILAFMLITWASKSLASPLTLTSPSNGATLTGTNVELVWETNGIDATQWWVRAGVSAQDRSLYDSGRITNANTRRHTIRGLPNDGSQVHVQLAYKNSGGSWETSRYLFNSTTPSNNSPATPTTDVPATPDTDVPESSAPSPSNGLAIVSPQNRATLPGASFELRWEAGGINATQWIVRAGSTLDGRDIHDSGRIFGSNTRSHALTGIPTDGSTVYLALSYKEIAGSWTTERYRFTAATTSTSDQPQPPVLAPSEPAPSEPTPPEPSPSEPSDEFNPFAPTNGLALVSPENRATLPGSSFDLLWEANGINASQWIIRAGSTADGRDIYDSGRITTGNTRRHRLTGMPTDGSTVFLALSYKAIAGNWTTVRYTFTAGTSVTPPTDQSPPADQPPPSEPPPNNGGNFERWSNTETPPPMNAERFTVVRQLNQLNEIFWSPAGQSNFHCRGNVYTISGSGKNNDLFLDASNWGTITQPIIIRNFRNVIVLGLDIEATTIPGCGTGEKLMFWRGIGSSWLNDHPHLPSDRLLGFDIYGVSWVEGNHSRMKGHAADHIVTNGGSNQTLQQVNDNRWTKIINSRHTGAEGNGAGLHGDWAENQDSGDQHAQAGFVAENSTSKTAYNHATLGYRGGSRWGVIKMHNVMVVNDPNYHTDQTGTGRASQLRPDEINGVCVVGLPEVWDIKRLMCQPAGETLRVAIRHSSNPRQFVYAPRFHDGTPTNQSTQGSSLVDRSELIEIKGGWENDSYLDPEVQAWISANDPALPENVGNNYVSPWQDLYSTY